jgi:C1A family cysteine protease
MSDLRSQCNPIQDQGECGSCTAFGTIGVWEAVIRILENATVKLSERDLFFCSGGLCQLGNTIDNILNGAKNWVCSEECLPTDTNGLNHLCHEGRCSDWALNVRKLESWKAINSISEMKRLLDTQPLVGTMEVHQSFMNYVNGVYHSLGVYDPVLGGHCIGIVGYDDSKGAWLIRNSWGTGWGMEGYAWVKYGDSEIDGEMFQVIPSSDTSPDPSPSPCKLGNGLAKIGSFFSRLLRRKGRFFYLNP